MLARIETTPPNYFTAYNQKHGLRVCLALTRYALRVKSGLTGFCIDERVAAALAPASLPHGARPSASLRRETRKPPVVLHQTGSRPTPQDA